PDRARRRIRDGGDLMTKRPGRILLVDDDPDFRATITEFLEGVGFVVAEAASGEDALGILGRGFVPGAIVTDIAMPGVDGVEFLRRLHRDPRLDRIPVVIVTSSEYSFGYVGLAETFLRKPFPLDRLLETLSAWVEH